MVRRANGYGQPIELSTTLAADTTSAAQARRFMRSALARLGTTSQEEVAELLVSELVTNAVLHAGSAPAVNARVVGPRLRVEVSDNSPTPPVRRHYDPWAPGGRGLLLVGRLAAAWGSEPAGGGKRVWFELQADPARQRQPSRQLNRADEVGP